MKSTNILSLSCYLVLITSLSVLPVWVGGPAREIFLKNIACLVRWTFIEQFAQWSVEFGFTIWELGGLKFWFFTWLLGHKREILPSLIVPYMKEWEMELNIDMVCSVWISDSHCMKWVFEFHLNGSWGLTFIAKLKVRCISKLLSIR